MENFNEGGKSIIRAQEMHTTTLTYISCSLEDFPALLRPTTNGRARIFKNRSIPGLIAMVMPRPSGLIYRHVTFNATTGTDREGYESCVGPYSSRSRDESSSMLLDFAKSRRLRIAGSWFQRPAPLDLVFQWWWCKERDRSCTCRLSLETCPELQDFSERRV